MSLDSLEEQNEEYRRLERIRKIEKKTVDYKTLGQKYSHLGESEKLIFDEMVALRVNNIMREDRYYSDQDIIKMIRETIVYFSCHEDFYRDINKIRLIMRKYC